ncbi:hypothetical protein NEMBOFW57_007485 [Staphylotrichum longicolle]|uniref:Uncharacterized protein n=1 Tax=Staphylotrichum longicolle TaxID=669026 RepID=A0AAD4EUK3_9PEZI|nr:hypothetical protein NEMBOFW57_007485 [Staphylotrichum longicolle]
MITTAHEQPLFSHVPGLCAGKQDIEVNQEIKVTETSPEKKTTPAERSFKVLAPRFVLRPDCVSSTYPAPSGSAPVETLAHVVLNDSRLPWERGFDTKPSRRQDAAADEDGKTRNQIPWLAVLTFEADELLLTPQQLKGDNERKSIFAATSRFASRDGVEQTGTLSVKLDLSDFVNLDKSQVVTPYESIDGESQPVGELVFIKPELFNHLFTKLDKNGRPAPGQTHCSVSRYQYLSHVRLISTEGMADAGEDDTATNREFSVVISHRTGPPGRTHPASLVSHLVSVEGVDEMSWPADPSKLVALPSLHSWTHTCLPEGSLKLDDTLMHLGQTQAMLRAPEASNFDIASTSPIIAETAKRLQDGYTLVRWHPITGETTAAFTRGPFVPKKVDPVFPRETLSNTGTSLEIFDKTLGMMDLTYSLAWQLGRTLALADQSFTTAIGRVRKEILQKSNDRTRRALMLPTETSVMERTHVIGRLDELVSQLAELPTTADVERASISMTPRWQRPPKPTGEAADHNVAAKAEDILEAELRHAAFRIGSSVDHKSPRIPDDDDPEYGPPYDEHNTAASADWMAVLNFVLDLLYLIKVPFHYLVTDKSHLPPESLRFFHIDPNWTEVLVDGALGLGNHIDSDGDRVRAAMKEAIMRYREHINPDLGYKPPVPTYGFLMRSAVVNEFPDLVVSTGPKVNPDRQPLIVRHEILSPGVLLVLMTEDPGMAKPEFLTFARPPQQQCFTAAQSLTRQEIRLAYKSMRSAADHEDHTLHDPITLPSWRRGDRYDDPDPAQRRPCPYVWGTTPEQDDLRILNVEHLAQHLYTTIKERTQESFEETTPTSTMFGIQLNEPGFQLRIKFPDAILPPPRA